MIKFKNTDVWGFEHALRGMRNPMNSWNKAIANIVETSMTVRNVI